MPNPKARSADGISPHASTPSVVPSKKPWSLPVRHTIGAYKMLFSIVGLLIIAVVLTWFFLLRTTTSKNPFTPAVAASVQFPLYYPTKLPSGFKTDIHTVQEPQAGVIVFELKGPANKKIYVSEEKRPSTFNLGGFYKNFSNRQVITSNKNGEIAIGTVENGSESIGSLAFTSTDTWVIINANTSAISPSQIVPMLESLTLNK